MDTTDTFEVIVGTYEQFLLGYTVDDIVNKYKMEQSFAMHSHMASIRSVASCKHYLASSAADDTICLFNMRNRMDSGKLTHHSDTVNCIAFTPDASHLISGSSDGSIGIVRCGNWQLEKHWLKPHKGMGIEALAIHPTGKVAMSTGRDGVLRTWNLVKGRQAYATNLVPRWRTEALNIHILKWSPSGEHYLLAAGKKLDIYSVETAGIVKELCFEFKIVCVEFLTDELIAIGFENGKIVLYNTEQGEQTFETSAHDARVKCMVCKDNFLLSASSSGEIKLWSFLNDDLTMLNKVTCNARISCIAISTCKSTVDKKLEPEVQETVLEKKTNKTRLRQEVIIEDEGVEEVKKAKKKKNKKKRKAENEDPKEIIEETEVEPARKKFMVEKTKKRKHEATIEQDSIAQEEKNNILKKQKKQKKSKDTTLTANENINSNKQNIKKTVEKTEKPAKINKKRAAQEDKDEEESKEVENQEQGKKKKKMKTKNNNKTKKRRSDEQNAPKASQKKIKK